MLSMTAHWECNLHLFHVHFDINTHTVLNTVGYESLCNWTR